MRFLYLKLAFTTFIFVFVSGVIFVILKERGIIPSFFRIKNIDYQNSEIKKVVSLVSIERRGTNYLIKFLNLDVSANIKTILPLQDFKLKDGKYVYTKKLGLEGNVIPIYIKLDIEPNRIIGFSRFTVGNLKESNIKKFLLRGNRLKNLYSYVFIKTENNRCGILRNKDNFFIFVCDIDKNYIDKTVDLSGTYLIASNSVVKLPININLEGRLSENEKEIIRKNVKLLILADTFLNKAIINKIKLDFSVIASSIYKNY